MRYKLTVSGTYRYARGDDGARGRRVQHAATARPGARSRRRHVGRDRAARPVGGRLSRLAADRVDRRWLQCERPHLQRIVTFPTTAPMQLRVYDATHGDDTGSLKVVIQRV